MDNVNDYHYLFWLLFLYYSFAALDELVELYACIWKREKGSIGLLFELNNFLGVGIMIYIGWFYFNHHTGVPAPYKQLEQFLQLQVYLLWAVLGISFLMFVCMYCMQRRLVRTD